ncbi:phage tail tip fiber protein [Azospirillum sp. Marseille-Q6669]
MAFVYPDRASEVTTSTGDQGDIILQGPEPSFWSFTSRMAVGDETTVCREDGLTSELVRVRLVAPDRLRYLAVYGSSNGGARVVWPAGQQRVYATQLGRYALLPPDAGQAGRPVVVQPDGTYGAGALTVPVPTGLTLGTLLDAASAGGRPDGVVLIRLVVTWDEVPGLDYELEIRDGLTTGWPGTASNPTPIPAGGGRCVVNVVGGYTYGVRLRARAISGVSGWTPEKTIAATGDDVPPGPPTDMAVTEVYGGAVFTFTPPADADTLEVRFYAAPADDKTAAMLVGAGLRRVTLTGLPAGATRWVWAASVDTSGNEGEWIALGPVTALRIEPGDLAEELGERIERLPASLDLAGEAALEAVLAAQEVRQSAQARLDRTATSIDRTIDDVRTLLDGVEGDVKTLIRTETSTRILEYEALTESISTVASSVGDAVSLIYDEALTLANEDLALAERMTFIATQMGEEISAAIQMEASARADEDGALALRIDTVISQMDIDIAAAIYTEASTRVSEDEALALRIDSLTTQMGEDIAAAIHTEALARADKDGALVIRIDSLTTQMGEDIAAAVQEETNARVTALDAVAQDITKLFARFSGGTNLVQRLNRWTSPFPVTEDVAFASRYRVRVSGNAQSVVSPALAELKPDTDYVLSFKARLVAGASSELHADLNPDTLPETAFAVTSSEWTTFSTVWKSSLAAIRNCRLRFFQYNLAGAQVDVTDVQLEEGNTPSAWSLAPGEMVALVQQESEARASAIGTVSSLVSTVETTANGNSATIQEQASSIDGLEAQYTVKVDVNGYVSGFGLASTPINGVPYSTFTVLADKFEVVMPGAAKTAPFTVQNGKVYIKSAVIGDAWIADTHIGPNGIDAAKLRAGTVLAGTITVGGTALSTVASNAATGAQDPVTRINDGDTSINPGKIIVKGSNTLTTVGGWLYGDTTEINGGKIAAETVTAREMKTGTLTIDLFAEFSTGNQLANSDFSAGWECWDRARYLSDGEQSIIYVADQEGWHPKGGHCLAIFQNNAYGAGFCDINYTHPASNWSGIPVVPGTSYEFSVFVSTHRCIGQIFISWLDVNGNEIAYAIPDADGHSNNEPGDPSDGTRIEAWRRLWVRGVAPVNARMGRPKIRKHATLSNPSHVDSWLFAALALFGECAPNATLPQSWQPGGVTRITGGQIASDSVIIRNNSQLGDATVRTLSIGENQVTVPVSQYFPGQIEMVQDFQTVAEIYNLVSIGQPILIIASLMHILQGNYGLNEDTARPMAELRLLRGKQNSAQNGWDWVPLLENLGGSLSNMSAYDACSRPWTYTVVDNTQGSGNFAYALQARKAPALDNARAWTPYGYASLLSKSFMTYRSLTAIEVRR